MRSNCTLKSGESFYGTPPHDLEIRDFQGLLFSIFIKTSPQIGIVYFNSKADFRIIITKIKIIIKKIKEDNISPQEVSIKCLYSSCGNYKDVLAFIKKLHVVIDFKIVDMVNVKINNKQKKVFISAKCQKLEKNDKIDVLIVDDSPTMRKVLKELLRNSKRINNILEAQDAIEAEKLIISKNPDVITLDINMPGMDGVTFLKKYIKKYPIPTIMVTSFNINDSGHIIEALEYGAFDYIEKPSFKEIRNIKTEFLNKIYSAFDATNKIGRGSEYSSKRIVQSFNQDDIYKYILTIGASTGGTEALKKVLTGLPENIPATLIVQHIPPVFSKAFADRMNELCPFTVKEAEDGDLVEVNKVIIAQGGQHLKLCEKGGRLYVRISDDPPVNRFKPSVDYLFDSISLLKPKKNILGVLLTGMGNDGAKGLLNLKNMGAYTIAQDEESSVVFGMPKAAIEIDAHCQIETLDKIAGLLVKKITEGIRRRPAKTLNKAG